MPAPRGTASSVKMNLVALLPKNMTGLSLSTISYQQLTGTTSIWRHESLQVEKCWPTHHFWTKVFNAYVGMSAVQQQRLYSYQYPGIESKDMPIKRFSDMIAAGLVEWERKILPRGLQTPATRAQLKRVADPKGHNHKYPTTKNRKKGEEKLDLRSRLHVLFAGDTKKNTATPLLPVLIVELLFVWK
jgi:hypothetical protein